MEQLNYNKIKQSLSKICSIREALLKSYDSYLSLSAFLAAIVAFISSRTSGVIG